MFDLKLQGLLNGGRELKVVVTDHNFKDVHAERAAAQGAEFHVHQCTTADMVREAVAGADVVVVQFAPVTAEAIANTAPGARFVRYGVGYNNIDIGAARQTGREVAFVPDYCTDEVADHTAAMALALVRGLAWLDRDVRQSTWDVLKSAPATRSPREMRAGFLGLGRIGRAVAARLAAFGFQLAAYDPALAADEARQLGILSLGLDDLFATADLLVLHAPLTAETRHVVSRDRLAQMKAGALLVNTSRGGLVDEVALGDALRSGRLGGAALDVFEVEPLPADSPLRSAPRMLLTPHAAWYSDGALARLQSLAADEISRALRGQAPPLPRAGLRGAP